ncbi:MAG: PepSY domain-containing protein [Bacteroidota bacterium]|nr:PepSY domain-containing protein [Bacteroidota bacterium]
MASTMSKTMRVWHRYLGFFLAGIMAVYAVSGVVMIFRNTDFLKTGKMASKKLKPALSAEDLGKELRMGELEIESENGDVQTFEGGTYNKVTGDAVYKLMSLPPVMEKLTKLHKANTGQPLFFLNVFFGVSLLFFVVSAFWMFLPKTTIFKKGMYFAAAGLVLTVVLLFL